MSNSSVTKIEFSASPENCSVIKLHSKFFAFLLLLLLNGSINADALEPINIQGPSCADMGMVNVGGVCQNSGGGGFGGGSGGGGGGFGGGGSPPSPPSSELPECDTGDPAVDNTGDLREQLMAKSLADPDQPLEHGGLFWPDGNGGYDLLEFGIDIVGGSSQACRIVSPPHASFPPAEQWPSGVIFFHTHPYSLGDSACGGIILGGASSADRNYIDWLRSSFEESVQGMVMDKDRIYMYGSNVSEDEPEVERCE